MAPAATAKSVANLGGVSGVLAASCTGPVLAAILLLAGASGQADVGISLLFLFAIGLSLPYFALAVLLDRMPRAGRWLEAVKLVLGSAVLASGLAFGLSAFPEVAREIVLPGASTIAVAVLFIAAAVVIRLRGEDPQLGRAGARALVAPVVAASGFFLLLQPVFAPTGSAQAATVSVAQGAAAESKAQGPSVPALRSSPWTVTASRPVFAWDVVRTRRHLYASIERAKSARRPVLIDFYASWCQECREVEETIFSRPEIQSALSGFHTIRVDATKIDEEIREMGRRYGLSGVPALVWVSADGTVRRALTLAGVPSPRQLFQAIQRVKAGSS